MKFSWYLLFVVIVLLSWFFLPYSFEEIYGTTETRFSPLVMIFGSFIAGISSEGGGAVAFPVFTLIFEMSPPIARNFSFAIQSIGMTAATLLLLDLKVRIHRSAILLGTIGGSIGLILGSMVPTSALNYGLLKLGFVSVWLSFGLTLYYIFIRKKEETSAEITELTSSMKLQFIAFAIVGGVITAFFGNGIDIVMFSLLVLRFNVDIKTATATSIVLMTIHTVLGFGLHYSIIQDFGTLEFNMWLACIPIVIFGAPLGSFVLSKISKKPIAYFLITIIIVQYIGALFVIRPSALHLGYSILIVALSLVIFGSMRRRRV